MTMIKKLVFWTVFFLVSGALAFSQESDEEWAQSIRDAAAANAPSGGEGASPAEGAEGGEGEAPPSFLEKLMEGADVNTGFRVNKRRYMEFGLVNTDLGFSNSWFGIGDLFGLATGDNLEVNDLLDKGALDFELGLAISPVHTRIRMGDLFTLEVSTSAEANVNLAISDTTIKTIKTMESLINEINGYASQNNLAVTQSDITRLTNDINSLDGKLSGEGSAFAAIDIRGEKTVLKDKLWIKAGPSVYLPLFFMPKQKITMKGKADDYDESTGASYGFKTEGGIESWMIGEGDLGLGVDLSLEGRYALFSFLDAGASIANIPIVPAFMKNRQSFEPNISFAATLPGGSDLDFDPALEAKADINPKSVDNDNQIALRPVRFNFYGVVKPLKSRLILVKPGAGFSIKYPGTEYSYSTFNWGVEGQLNLPVILSVSLGIKQFENVWVNSALLVFDFRLFEFDVGAGLRGPDFASSWTAKGLNAVVGFKFGW